MPGQSQVEELFHGMKISSVRKLKGWKIPFSGIDFAKSSILSFSDVENVK